MRILLDLDEVLADFVGGAAKVWGTTKEELEKVWVLGTWHMDPALATVLGKTVAEMEDEFWGPIDGHPEFWSELEPLPWSGELIDLVSSLTDDWFIVSSPRNLECCRLGKERWIKRVFGKAFDRFHLTPYKHTLAMRDTVLIDDSDDNVKVFRANFGAYGIVFPKINNSLHAQRNDPMKHVRSTLKYLAAYLMEKK